MTAIEDRLRTLSDTTSQAPDLALIISRGTTLRRRRRTRRMAIAAGTLAVALLVAPSVSFVGHVGTSEASTFLTDVAVKAGSRPFADGPFWYSETDIVYGGQTYTRQSWQGRSRPGRLIQPDGVIGTTTLPPAVFPAGRTALTWDELLALPRDPEGLRSWLHDAVGDAGHDVDTEMFVAVGDLLRESPAPAPLRQALLEVAARIPDVELTEGLHDALGRPTTAVSRPSPNGEGVVLYLIDPATGAFLEQRDINSDGSLGFQATHVISGPAPDITTVLQRPAATP